eukprot:NODE_576_length_1466_cov_327.807938.p1 GENE.NODE_576_length_1466_cov_327.807938~~NODE_576_length_1466_cov_327.807938.p1  ORF type:complete len:382 (+),score=80.37 NODE_576_length_1466_cov_327.807938:134-1279(+)
MSAMSMFETIDVPGDHVQCDDKYSEKNIRHYIKKFWQLAERRGHPPRIYLTANMHQNVHAMASLMTAMIRFVERLGPDSVFVSIVESGSNDGTTEILDAFAHDLKDRRIPHVIHTRVALFHPIWEDENPESGLRIPFLAKLRNAAMAAFYKMGGKQFTSVLFVNDVFLCEGDMWRLVSFDADMTCGYDFFDGIFYDQWVYDGPYDENCTTPNDGRYHTRCHLVKPYRVRCCWNGVAAIRSEVFAELGIRFRWGVHNDLDCQNSECSALCRDMKRLDVFRIISDPNVQVTYRAEDMRCRRRLSESALWDDRRSYDEGQLDHDSWRCCPLDGAGAKWIDPNRCYGQTLSRDSGFVKPLSYVENKTLYEMPWLPEYWKPDWFLQ